MKRLKVLNKTLSYVSIALVVLIVALIINSGKMKNKYDDFTTYNTGEKGVKALYLLTEKMGYNTARYKRPARFMPDGDTLVVIKPDWDQFMDDTEEKYLREWVSRGNSLVFIDEDEDKCGGLVKSLDAGIPEEIDGYGDWLVYNAGKGKIYLNNLSLNFTNEGLKDYTPGVSFIKVLDMLENRNVSFDEYYHGMGTVGVTVWDILGTGGMLVFIQFLIGLAVLLFILSRRFGKPVTVFETIKRKENENIYALSNIYSKAKAYGLVLETILEKFRKEILKYLGLEGSQGVNEIIRASKENKYLSEMDIESLLTRCSRFISSEGGDIKELVYLTQWIEKIRKGIL